MLLGFHSSLFLQKCLRRRVGIYVVQHLLMFHFKKLLTYCYFSEIIKSFITTSSSNHPDVLCKKGVLRFFAKLTGKHLCQNLFLAKVFSFGSLFSIKLQAFRPSTFFKRESNIGVFCKYCENFKNTYFEEYLWTPASERHYMFRRFRFLMCEIFLKPG